MFFVSDDMYFLPNSSMDEMSLLYKGIYPTWNQEKYDKLKDKFPIDKNKKVKNLKPLIYGGGQENGLRSGTENVFGIKVFEYAFLEHNKTLYEDYKKN
mgnify:CR=1 FL=1